MPDLAGNPAERDKLAWIDLAIRPLPHV